jgi:hypothetical protein
MDRPILDLMKVACLLCAIGLVGCGEIQRGDDADTTPDGGTSSPDADPNVPRLSVTGGPVREGDTVGGRALFEVNLLSPAADEVSVSYATSDGTATTDAGDYEPASGTLVFDPGETSVVVEVNVTGDFASEPDERFRLVLDQPVGAAIENGEAEAILRDDDRGFDFNGDGFADILVGDAFAATGEVYLFFGGPGPEPGGTPDAFNTADADVVFSGATTHERFGAEVAGGDVNGDGFDDVIVSATVGPSDAAVSTVAVFAGSAAPDPAIDAARADAIISGPVLPIPAAHLTVVDIDGDGLSDVLIGGRDAARLYAGSPSWTGGLQLGPDDARATFVDGAASEFFPVGVGDFNGDGVDDLVITTGSFVDGSSAHLFLGGSRLDGQVGLAASDATFAFGDTNVVAATGGADMNGDQLADIVLGFSQLDAIDGVVHVVYGRVNPTGALAADVTITSDADQVQFGSTVSLAGDLDGDGFGDLAAGMPIADPPNAQNGGIALLFLGASDLPSTFTTIARNLEVHADGGGDALSEALAVIDYNGDGFHDLVLGAPESGLENRGNVYVFLGFAGAFRDGEPNRLVTDADVSFAPARINNHFGGALAQ